MAYPSFSSGDVLNASDMNAVGLWLIKTQTVGSAVSSVTVTSAFSSTYDAYVIKYTGGNTSSSGYWYTFQFSAAHTTGYYGYASSINYLGTTTVQGTDNLGRLLVGRTNPAQGSVSLLIHVDNPQGAMRKPIYGNSNTGPGWILHGGEYNTTSTFSDFVIGVSGGTMTGGTIRVYGYRN